MNIIQGALTLLVLGRAAAAVVDASSHLRVSGNKVVPSALRNDWGGDDGCGIHQQECDDGSCVLMYVGSCPGDEHGAGAHTIKICANEMILVTPRPAVGAHVRCWDKDPNSDDFMAEGDTGSDGCAELTYTEQSWDGVGGGSPDILCAVTKNGFVEAAPPRLDQHNQYTLAELEDVTLYRDRREDHGHDNGCGPAVLEPTGFNDVAAWALQFRDQCTMHDKCYWDCQIFLASRNADEAQEFCDSEMLMSMQTSCRVHSGDIPGGTTSCLVKAEAVYQGLSLLGGILAYDKTNDNCPDEDDGEGSSSMENDYSHTPPLMATLEG